MAPRAGPDAGAGPEAEAPCADCFGRDVFGGADPEAAAPPLPAPDRRSIRSFISDHRRLFGLGFAAVLITLFVVAVLPQLTGIRHTLRQVGRGNHTWLLLGVALEAISIGGYIALFRSVFSCEGTRIGWRASYEITLAGVVATKLLAAAGAGGIALTAWALRASGLSGRTIARRMAGFEIVLYTVFMLALVVAGVALGLGAFGIGAPWTLSYVPAGFGAVVIALALVARFIPGRLEHAAAALATGRRRLGRLLARLATVPASIRDGMLIAVEMVRSLNPGLLGALIYWGFDIATLWASFKAFSAPPPVLVIVMGYYVGQLANAIPLPGGIGGVEGGMIGCFIALHVNASSAIIGVFAYRAISFWLPTLPGAVAYFQLRRRIAGWNAGKAAPAEGPANLHI